MVVGAGLGGEHELSPEVSAAVRTFFLSPHAFVLSVK